FAAGTNFYRYAGNGAVNFVDPSGLRDIFIVIWNRQIAGEDHSVGHVVALEMNGDVILSQFPTPHASSGKNTRSPDWADTYMREGRDPDDVFIVHVPNDDAFDGIVLDRLNRPTWNWLPTNDKETNC